MLFATCIWSALSHNWDSFVAARIICAFAGSCGEALPATVVKDLFFLHERGRWMGIYMFFFQAALQFGGIASAFIITAKGWRWLFWVRLFFVLLMYSLFPLLLVLMHLQLFSFSPRRSI
jgi:MFS family permease